MEEVTKEKLKNRLSEEGFVHLLEIDTGYLLELFTSFCKLEKKEPSIDNMMLYAPALEKELEEEKNY